MFSPKKLNKSRVPTNYKVEYCNVLTTIFAIFLQKFSSFGSVIYNRCYIAKNWTRTVWYPTEMNGLHSNAAYQWRIFLYRRGTRAINAIL